jgi:hypothetical protein
VTAFLIDGFLARDTCVSSTHLNSIFGTKQAFLHILSSGVQELFLSKTNSVLIGKEHAKGSCF